METKTNILRYVEIELTDGIGVMKINRPETLNALNGELLDEMEYVLHEMEQNAAVKVVVVASTSKKAFVAGADIKEMHDLDPIAAQAFSRKAQQVMLFLQKIKKPIIAAVNGYALGGGLELALACDFIYASDKAKIGFPEVTLGVIPGFGGTQNLARLIGPNKAKEMIFSGKTLSAQQAKEWGIFNEVFPAEELLTRVLEIAQVIAHNGTTAVVTAKDAIVNGQNMTKEDGFRYESALFGTLFATQDLKERMQAFLDKRKAE